MSSDNGSPAPQQPLFRAVASSTRHIYQMLKCISFVPKVLVEVTHEGIRFAADYSRVMNGMAFLDKVLFTTYNLNIAKDSSKHPCFQMNLAALLEALQIFGATDAAAKAAKGDGEAYRSNLRNYRPDAFSHQALGMPGTCCLMYESPGSPLSVILEESGVKTQCNMVTYVPDFLDDIPFDRDDLSFKIIMQARWLLDALSELAPMNPARMTIKTTTQAPYLSISSGGSLGSASVDFSNGRELLETFAVQEHWAQSYKFDLVRSASEAMRIANKVSFRGDGQGVLSLQFMVENEGGIAPSFLDFRFVPYITQEDDASESGSDAED
ncbi:Rad1-domain-containing protein [Xylariomycetidae sp. FL2044]|nr:Rad1-domain-containing protein [Xylariomycetidae sp. FL2044]